MLQGPGLPAEAILIRCIARISPRLLNLITVHRLLVILVLVLARGTLLVLVDLMTGNAAAEGTENAVMSDMSRNGAGNASADAANRLRGLVAAKSKSHGEQRYYENTSLHILDPLLYGRAEHDVRLLVDPLRWLLNVWRGSLAVATH